MIEVTIKKEREEKVEVEPGYYKDSAYHHFLNKEGELLSIGSRTSVCYLRDEYGIEKELAKLVESTPCSEEEFYEAMRALSTVRSQILSK